MNIRKFIAPAFIAAAGVVAIAGSLAIAQPSGDAKPATANTAAAAAAPAMQLPPGWTEADMMACMQAGTPGENQARLAKDVGEWEGKTTMWMFPGAEPVTSQCSSKVTAIYDGRYVKTEFTGEMPGMGPFSGMGIQGFNNVTGKFVGIWIDTNSTGIMNGTGDLSEDGKSINWVFTNYCPITKKLGSMQQVDSNVEANTKTLVMHGADPKTGQEFKMIEIELKRKQ